MQFTYVLLCSEVCSNWLLYSFRTARQLQRCCVCRYQQRMWSRFRSLHLYHLIHRFYTDYLQSYEIYLSCCVDGMFAACSSGVITQCQVLRGFGVKTCDNSGNFGTCIATTCDPNFALQDGACIPVSKLPSLYHCSVVVLLIFIQHVLPVKLFHAPSQMELDWEDVQALEYSHNVKYAHS